MLSIAYLFFLIFYFREYEEKNELEQQSQLIQIQANQSLKEVEIVRRFCANELVNTVLSYYNGLMEQQGIQLDLTVSTEETLPCSEQEFTSILSNRLENAMHAVAELGESKRIVTLQLKSDSKKVYLSIQNPYEIAPVFVDGIPVTSREGHGLGTLSIRYTTHKLKGNCQFMAEDGVFSLRIVL